MGSGTENKCSYLSQKESNSAVALDGVPHMGMQLITANKKQWGGPAGSSCLALNKPPKSDGDDNCQELK